MPNILPVDVVVRPRVAASDGGDSRLLEEVIAEVADECPIGVVWLVGGPGSGKSTALAHLAARFADDERFVFLDGPTTHEATRKRESRLVVATAPSSAKRGENILRLQPWGIDDLLEFLLAAHPAACQSVLARLGTAARQSWAPQLARIVLDRFAGDPTLTDPIDALLLEVHQLLPSPADLADATEFCLAQLLRDTKRIAVALKSLSKTDGFHCVLRLLRHTQVQVPLAAARVMAELKSRRSLRLLARQLPSDLVDLVGKRCRENPEAVRHLAGRLTKPRSQLGDAMAASMMIRADLSWRPNPKPGGHWKLSGGYFQGASWARIELANADISKCDLSGAQLAAAALEHAVATGAQFAGAELYDANMIRLHAMGASFQGSILQRANLSHADLKQADFTEADITNAALKNSDLTGANLELAILRGADLSQAWLIGAEMTETDLRGATLRSARLSHVDLRSAELEGASFEQARLSHAQLEDIQMTNARFQGAKLEHADLTGSALPGADLRDANLTGAHLAEIHWERADLRGADLHGASFHMGSSRSGLVGSPIALEGSMTGFYTDDRGDIYFKRPEEIRKANLRGADLRGARTDNVDFYLVDLRDARLDPAQLRRARRTGAILSDTVS